MTRLIAAAALAVACVTVAPAAASDHRPCDRVNCPTTCLPGCIPDPVDRCYYVQDLGKICV